MASPKPENQYKSRSRYGGKEGKSCDILSIPLPLGRSSPCLRPLGSCVECPVGTYWREGEKKSGLDLDQAIKMAKERVV